jgi:hypothetical protein
MQEEVQNPERPAPQILFPIRGWYKAAPFSLFISIGGIEKTSRGARYSPDSCSHTFRIGLPESVIVKMEVTSWLIIINFLHVTIVTWVLGPISVYSTPSY